MFIPTHNISHTRKHTNHLFTHLQTHEGTTKKAIVLDPTVGLTLLNTSDGTTTGTTKATLSTFAPGGAHTLFTTHSHNLHTHKKRLMGQLWEQQQPRFLNLHPEASTHTHTPFLAQSMNISTRSHAIHET